MTKTQADGDRKICMNRIIPRIFSEIIHMFSCRLCIIIMQ